MICDLAARFIERKKTERRASERAIIYWQERAAQKAKVDPEDSELAEWMAGHLMRLRDREVHKHERNFIYVAENWDNLKVGVSSDPQRRVRNLRSISPELHELSLVKSWPGSFFEEKVLHIALRKFRLRGEWFYFCEESWAIINEHAARPFHVCQRVF